jgi:hypothetical protein
VVGALVAEVAVGNGVELLVDLREELGQSLAVAGPPAVEQNSDGLARLKHGARLMAYGA